MLVMTDAARPRAGAAHLRYLLAIAGLGGLLYGIDIGIIAGALPYLEATASVRWQLSAHQLGLVVAAVLLGSVLASLFAGALADSIGRKWCLVLSGAAFTASIPVIAMSDGYTALLLGRLLQGVSGGLIGVVVPLYLAECLDAGHRGRGTALFQLLLTIGLVAAALIGLYYAHEVQAIVATQGSEAVAAAKDQAWRHIFWLCLPPGLLFTVGALRLDESPRWLLKRGRRDAARRVLLRSHGPAQADAELAAMSGSSAAVAAAATDSLLSRRYVLPFLLACLILVCNQATGINSILAYSVNILGQAGLPGALANLGDVAIKTVNALMTVVAVALVDRKGRKFLLTLGSGGIVIALAAVGLLFQSSEDAGHDVSATIIASAQDDALVLRVDEATLQALGAAGAGPRQLVVAYAYGDFSNVQMRRSDDPAQTPLTIRREGTVKPDSVIGAFFRRLHLNPFPDPVAAARAPLRIERAQLRAVPSPVQGWLVLGGILVFVAFFAVGPGVCVWLALSELMPTRIRSNGMSIALLLNLFFGTSVNTVFLPVVGHHGYAPMFYFWASCTVVYFLAAAFLLPETRGKTLEQIEDYFQRRR